MKKIFLVIILVLLCNFIYAEWYYFKSIDTYIQIEQICYIQKAVRCFVFENKSGIDIYFGKGFSYIQNYIFISDELEIKMFLDYIKGKLK